MFDKNLYSGHDKLSAIKVSRICLSCWNVAKTLWFVDKIQYGKCLKSISCFCTVSDTKRHSSMHKDVAITNEKWATQISFC